MKPPVGHMRDLPLALILLTSGIIALACATQAPVPTPTLVPTATPAPTPSPAPTINIEATVSFLVKAALPTVTPTPTPDIEATVEASIQATMEAIPTPTPTSTPTAVPPTRTPTPTPTAVPTYTPRPTPTAVLPTSATVLLNPYRVIQQSVVKIISSTSRGTAQGSGVIVGHGNHVITNAHVIDGAIGTIQVSFYPESGPPAVTNAQVVFIGENVDLALVKMEGPLGEPIEVARGLPDLGDTLILGGFPEIGGETLTITTGTAAGFDANGTVIKFDGQIGSGSSGGPAVDTEGRMVGIATRSSSEPSGGKLGLLLSITAVGHRVVRALLDDSQPETPGSGSRYLLRVVGIPADATVPEGWDIMVNFGYFDMRAPGTATDVLDKDYRVVGIFTRDLVAGESAEEILDRIVAESEGGFDIVPDSQINPPEGFSGCVLLYSDRRFEISNFEARGSVIGNGWVSVAGLHTRFCVGQTATKTVIGYVESPNRESSKEDGQLLSSSITILSD